MLHKRVSRNAISHLRSSRSGKSVFGLVVHMMFQYLELLNHPAILFVRVERGINDDAAGWIHHSGQLVFALMGPDIMNFYESNFYAWFYSVLTEADRIILMLRKRPECCTSFCAVRHTSLKQSCEPR